MSKHEVDILLSTYNGAQFIPEQIESLLAQTNQGWKLLIRDDGSTDATLQLLYSYQAKYPERINVIPGGNLGVIQSFNELLKLSDSPYVMFCDQDDRWFPDKVEIMLRAVRSVEEENSVAIPVMAFSDLALMDEEGAELNLGFWGQHGVNPHHSTLNRLLLQNVVTGCACIFNRALVQKALPIPQEAIMHDWWLALNAVLFGKLVVIDRQTVYYRQHSGNQVGARGVNFNRLLQLYKSGESIKGRVAMILRRTTAQAAALLRVHSGTMSCESRNLIENFSRLGSANYLQRNRFLLRNRILFSSQLRNLCLFLL